LIRRLEFIAACVFAAAACGRPAPPRAAASKLAAAVRGARDSGPCRSVVAQEWPVGWPVPVDGANGRRFKIFFYPLSGAPPRLATPSAEAVVDADAGLPIECRVLPGIPKDIASPRWTPAALKLSADEFDAKTIELDRLTEDVAAVYAARRPPTLADAELTRRYVAVFETMAEPPLLADYYRLNPAFWEWVRAVAGRSIAKTDS
jgi:hypothetical protein